MNEFNSKYFKTALRMDEALIALLEKKDLEYIAAFRNPNDMQAHARYDELKKRLLSPILDRFSVPAPYHRYYIAYYN